MRGLFSLQRFNDALISEILSKDVLMPKLSQTFLKVGNLRLLSQTVHHLRASYNEILPWTFRTGFVRLLPEILSKNSQYHKAWASFTVEGDVLNSDRCF